MKIFPYLLIMLKQRLLAVFTSPSSNLLPQTSYFKFHPSFLIIWLIIQSQVLQAQNFVISGSWKVNFEDRKEFGQADWDDAGWAVLPGLRWSDNHNTTANRVLWIRKSVVIPSSLKTELEKSGLLTLSMGKISQSDDTYLNGKLIGSTGSGDSYRNYLVNKDDILWDKENSIAIRARHWGTFQVSVIPQLLASSPSHFLTYGSGLKMGDSKAPVMNKDLTGELTVTNRSPKSIDGKVKADFYNFGGQKIYSSQKNITIAPGKNTIEFPYHSTSAFLKIVYVLSVTGYQYQQEWNAEFGYENLVYKRVAPVVAYKAPQRYYPADLEKQSIGGWMGERLKANRDQRLHKVDEEALLAGFINRPGNHSWIGEHIGKFLEAACNAYANEADAALKIQIDRSAQHLIAAQLSDGYLGTYEMYSHWTSWDVWSHRYDLMGLLRYYELSGFKPALIACQKIGNLLIKTFGTEKGQRDIIKAGGHVGMAATCVLESMAELYRFSGDKRYLDYCYIIIKSYDSPNGPHIISMLDSIGRVDKVANAKAYEMLSNMLGVLKLYRLTNDDQFLQPMLTAWNDITQNRLYITGASSSFEHFQDNQVLPGDNNSNIGEGCVTTTWIQFNFQLLCITGEMKYLNELERSVYNHLTGAENPQTGCVSYYTPLVGVKPYGCSITCCMSSVPRAITMIPLFTNGKINNIPTFLFYQPGVYSTTVGKNANVSFTTATNFPLDGNISINVDKAAAAPYAINFRKPYWAVGFAMTINGQKQPVGNKGAVSIKRIWNKGDRVSISFTMPAIVLDGGKTYPGKVALQRGPQVLAFDKNMNGFDIDRVMLHTASVQLQPALEVLPKQWIGGLAFRLTALENNIQKYIILVPYADASQTGGDITTWINKESK